MKLPEDFERNDDMAYLKHNYPLTFEAIVRDCAKALNKFENCTTTNCVAAEMLLARYGLEAKP